MVNHLILWVNIFTFALGFSSFILVLLSYLKYRKKVILLYTGYIFAFILEELAVLFQVLYTKILNYYAMGNLFFRIKITISNIGLAIIVLVISIGLHLMFSIPVSKFKKFLFSILMLIYAITLILEPLVSVELCERLFLFVELPILYSTVLTNIFLVIVHRKNVNKENHMGIIYLFISLSLLFFFTEMFMNLTGSFENIHITIYILALNAFTIHFTLKYFNNPAYYIKNRPTNFFIEKFGVSEREVEVLNLLLLGNSNKDISDKLFISVKTVESHLRSCYKKTDVKNRIQLYNLLQINSA